MRGRGFGPGRAPRDPRARRREGARGGRLDLDLPRHERRPDGGLLRPRGPGREAGLRARVQLASATASSRSASSTGRPRGEARAHARAPRARATGAGGGRFERLNAVAADVLRHLGLPVVRAPGEAEATCAARPARVRGRVRDRGRRRSALRRDEGVQKLNLSADFPTQSSARGDGSADPRRRRARPRPEPPPPRPRRATPETARALALALLAGGDYDVDGANRVGATLAARVVREAPTTPPPTPPPPPRASPVSFPERRSTRSSRARARAPRGHVRVQRGRDVQTRRRGQVPEEAVRPRGAPSAAPSPRGGCVPRPDAACGARSTDARTSGGWRRSNAGRGRRRGTRTGSSAPPRRTRRRPRARSSGSRS